MGVLDEIQGHVVGLDTAPLIYFMEKHPTYHPLVSPLFVALAAGQFTAVTSMITVVETMVRPLRQKQLTLARRYQEILLHTRHLTTYDLTPMIAAKAAEIRADYGLRTPDAIQLATVINGGGDFFLTNDHALTKYPDLQIILIDNLL